MKGLLVHNIRTSDLMSYNLLMRFNSVVDEPAVKKTHVAVFELGEIEYKITSLLSSVNELLAVSETMRYV